MRQLEAHEADDDQPRRHYPDRGGGVPEKEDAQGEGPDGADAGPYRVGGADRDCPLGQVQEEAALVGITIGLCFALTRDLTDNYRTLCCSDTLKLPITIGPVCSDPGCYRYQSTWQASFQFLTIPAYARTRNWTP